VAWLTITLQSDAGAAPRLAELLDEAGALAVTLHDGADAPVLEPAPGEAPLWPATLVEGLFEDRDAAGVLGWLGARLAPDALPAVAVGRLEDRDWVREGRAGFRPQRFGDRFWVCPSWCDPPDPQAVTLRLDPGLAFGTGTHPSTALCLEWLAAAPLTGARVLDFGCGSGVLAVAALLLGASHAWAVDHDPQALMATRENALGNGVLDRLEVGPPEALNAPPVDVVVANILAGPLIDLAPGLAARVAPGGALVLAGVLREQAPAVARAYAPWLALAVDAARDGWVRLAGYRPPAAG
jgi:ribosomal protein L11 methyltransferase